MAAAGGGGRRWAMQEQTGQTKPAKARPGQKREPLRLPKQARVLEVFDRWNYSGDELLSLADVDKAIDEEGAEDKEAIRLYDLICTELCGWGHYKMAGRVEVRSREKFDEWMAEQEANVMSNGKEDQS